MLFLRYAAYALCFLLLSFAISMLAGLFIRRMMSAGENYEAEATDMLQAKTRQTRTTRGRARKAAGNRR